MSGFIVIHRDMLDHHLLGDPARFKAWCWLIMRACWKPKKFDIQGKTIELQRGQLCASVRQLADEWRWSKSAVDRFLGRLQTEKMIEKKSGQGRLVITLCNYSKYQDVPEGERDSSGTAAGQQRDSSGTAAGHKRTREQGNKVYTPL